MTRRFSPFLLLALIALACGCSSRPAGVDVPWYEAIPGAHATRVGTVSRTEVLVAYYASAERMAVHKAMVAQRDAARAAGDTARVAELEAEGAANQEFAHRQLGGDAPLTNVIDAIRDHLPAIADAADVQAIMEEGGEVADGVEVIDVTDRIVALFSTEFESR